MKRGGRRRLGVGVWQVLKCSLQHILDLALFRRFAVEFMQLGHHVHEKLLLFILNGRLSWFLHT